MCVLSADHIIQDIKALHRSINIAKFHANEGKLVTFGVLPTNADTNYGYIKSSGDISNGALKVEEFIEKPNLQTAKIYLEQGNYFWNSGIFMFRADKIIHELTLHSHDIVHSVSSAIDKSKYDLSFIRLDKDAFESAPAISIDYALMEKSDNVVMVPLQLVAGIVAMIIGFLASSKISISFHDIFLAFLSGTFQIGLGFILITIGARKTLSAMVGIIMLTEAILGPLWGWLFVNENPSFYVLVGGGIIIFAVFLQFVSTFTKENKYNPR